MLDKKDTIYICTMYIFNCDHSMASILWINFPSNIRHFPQKNIKRKYHLHGLQKSDGSDFPSCLLVIQGEIIYTLHTCDTCGGDNDNVMTWYPWSRKPNKVYTFYQFKEVYKCLISLHTHILWDQRKITSMY